MPEENSLIDLVFTMTSSLFLLPLRKCGSKTQQL